MSIGAARGEGRMRRGSHAQSHENQMERMDRLASKTLGLSGPAKDKFLARYLSTGPGEKTNVGDPGRMQRSSK